MTITYDGSGNAFLGDGSFGNHSLSYPNSNYFKAYDLMTEGVSKLNTDISTIMTALSIPHAITGTFGSSSWTVDWSSPTDTTAHTSGRFRVYYTTTTGGAEVRNDAGVEVTSGDAITDSNMLSSELYTTNSDEFFRPQLVINISQQNFSMYVTVNTSTTVSKSTFVQASYLQNINTSFSVYTTPQINSCFVCRKNINSVWNGQNYLSPSRKNILTTGEANYPLVCSNGQNPASDWLTDWYIFDNNPSIGNPGIGRVPDMLVSNDTSFVLNQPSKIIGGVTPDAGNNRWLPVGYWMGKTILMRIYSSYTGS